MKDINILRIAAIVFISIGLILLKLYLLRLHDMSRWVLIGGAGFLVKKLLTYL